ncbi:hypothetical protein [Rhizobium sp. 21-4511-3d]
MANGPLQIVAKRRLGSMPGTRASGEIHEFFAIEDKIASIGGFY